MQIERAIYDIITGKRKAPIAKSALAALSFPYRCAIALKNFAYDRRLLTSSKLPIPVVSIGNLAVGGTGKTPLVQLLASSLQEKMCLAILSRGFRSAIEKSRKSVCISTGLGPLLSPAECGDEPFFLAQRTRAAVWVGPDRIASGSQAIAQGAQCLLLDDGMQHRRLARDFEIVLIDGLDPFSQKRFLPWGLLRDSPQRLKQASLIVANHVKDQKQHRTLEKLLAPFTSAPLVSMQVQVLDPALFPPRKAGLFCGIGRPEYFLQTMRDLNQEIVETLFLKDHDSFCESQLEVFAKSCRTKGAEVLLCTEKDAVKLSSSVFAGLNILPVGIELGIVAGEKHWKNLIQNIVNKVDK